MLGVEPAVYFLDLNFAIPPVFDQNRAPFYNRSCSLTPEDNVFSDF